MILRVKRITRRQWPSCLLWIGALAASLTSHPGKVPGDTKLYLYLDPTRLISDSVWSWDNRLFSGWVPHQNVGYLWPSGPFYALLEAMRIPDWIAHRFWIAALMIIAGSGALKLARFLGVDSTAGFLAGLAYQFTPYVLPYISRTSALLLPWSLLPWLVLYTMRYARFRRNFDLAVFAFLVASSGGLNATAVLMIVPAPVIWLWYLARLGVTTRREAVSALLRLGLVSVLVSLWWLVGLFVQGRYGAAVLSYSEALQSTAATSTAPEVLRGLGYWLFYDRGSFFPLTTASSPYQSSITVIAAGGILVLLGLWGILRSAHWKAPLSVMMIIGVILAVGAHPTKDPSWIFSPLADNPTSTLSLALRSSTRAVPLIVLALSLGLAFFWQERSRVRQGGRNRLALGMMVAVIIVNFPASVNGDLVDKNLLRPQDIPRSWQQAANYLDQRFDQGHTGSVLLVPGIESAAYRWGYPVDPLLPGLSKKPLLTRDWLPLGSPAVMDLLYAFDDSFQNGTADPAAIAPVARLLGADTVMFVSSHQFERFGTLRPSRGVDYFDPTPPGLTLLAQFGPKQTNVSSHPRWTEENVTHPDRALPEIMLFAVQDAGASARVHDTLSLASIDGTGLVDLAAMGEIDGTELILSEATITSTRLEQYATEADRVLVTDSNRRRAHHWRSSQDVWGATEPLVGVVTERDDFDSRLPVHPDQSATSETLIESSELEARATAYGAALKYQPEYRPRMAVDGDPNTAWRLGSDRSAVGHVLSLTSDEPLEELRLLQPLDAGMVQWITAVSVRSEEGSWIHHSLTEDSRTTPGQVIPLPEAGRRVDIRIDDVNDDRRLLSSLGVGLAEVVEPTLTSPEIVSLPSRVIEVPGLDVTYSLNRLRSDPFDRWRDDPEPAIRRRLPIAMESIGNLRFQVRLNSRATDNVRADALGWSGATSQTRLHGSSLWWGASAVDGNSLSSWFGPISTDTRSSGFGSLLLPLDEPLEWLEIDQGDLSHSSGIRTVRIDLLKDDSIVDSEEYELDPLSVQTLTDITSSDAEAMLLEVTSIVPKMIIDDFTGQSIPAPVGISELRSNAWTNRFPTARFDTGCRDDLVFLDGEPIPLRLTGSIASALRGEPVEASVCSIPTVLLRAGAFLDTTPGTSSGWDIDRVLITPTSATISSTTVENVDFLSSRGEGTATLSACSTTCWVELPFGFSKGWDASLADFDLGSPIRSASGRSLWEVPPGQGGILTTTWSPQKWMWWGLAISATSLFILALVLVRSLFDKDRRRLKDEAVHILNEDVYPFAGFRWRWSRAAAGTALGLVFVTPVWAVLIGIALALIGASRLRFFVVPAVGIGYLYIVVQQFRYSPDPGFGWPEIFEKVHRPLLAVLFVFVLAAHTSRAPITRVPTGQSSFEQHPS